MADLLDQMTFRQDDARCVYDAAGVVRRAGMPGVADEIEWVAHKIACRVYPASSPQGRAARDALSTEKQP